MDSTDTAVVRVADGCRDGVSSSSKKERISRGSTGTSGSSNSGGTEAVDEGRPKVDIGIPTRRSGNCVGKDSDAGKCEVLLAGEFRRELCAGSPCYPHAPYTAATGRGPGDVATEGGSPPYIAA